MPKKQPLRRAAPPRLRQLPPACRLYLGTVVLLAVAVLVLVLRVLPVDGAVATAAGALLLGCTASAVGSALLHRRSPLAEGAVSMDTSYAVAAALVLPLPWAPLVTAALHAVAVGLDRRAVVSYRTVFSVAMAVLSGLLMAAGVAAVRGLEQVAVSGLVAVLGMLAGTALLWPAVRLSAPGTTWRQAAGEPVHAVLELTLGCLGVVLAAAVGTSPWLVLFFVPVPALLYRLTELDAARRASQRDGKTGLLHASAWTEAATALLDRARQTGSTAAVVFLDLDHFKALNDVHGHLAGDLALQAAARALEQELRPGQLLGRFGGEEFVVFLAGTDSSTVHEAAERLRRTVSAVQVPSTDGPLPLSASAGAAAGRTGMLADLLAAADSALYDAKAQGRARTCTVLLDEDGGALTTRRGAAPPPAADAAPA